MTRQTDSSSDALIVFVKQPEPGKVKTRLVPPLSERQASELYANFILDAVSQYLRHLPSAQVHLFYSPSTADSFFERLLLNHFKKNRPRLRLKPQSGADLGNRMNAAFSEVLQRQKFERAVVIGSDHPSLPPEYLKNALSVLREDGTDVAIGPSRDGGYYLVGMKNPQPDIFLDMRWSTDTVLAVTLDRLEKLALSVKLLPEWYDVDDVNDLRMLRKDLLQEHVRREAPNTTRFINQLLKESPKILEE